MKKIIDTWFKNPKESGDLKWNDPHHDDYDYKNGINVKQMIAKLNV